MLATSWRKLSSQTLQIVDCEPVGGTGGLLRGEKAFPDPLIFMLLIYTLN